MALEAVNSLLENLWQLVNDENVSLITGKNDDIQQLMKALQALKDTLKNASYNEWKELASVIRTSAHSAEDFIDKIVVQEKLKNDPDVNQIRNLAMEFRGILEKVETICGNSSRHGLHPVLVNPPPIRRSQAPKELDMIGLKDEAEAVINYRLLEGPENVDVVSIVGMPGLGKTKLAYKIYSDSQISDVFVGRIWVDTGKGCNNIKSIFFNILKWFTSDIEKYQDEDVNELATVICNFMAIGGRYLIILDDISDGDIVDLVRKIFPENRKGHRILITTRDARVSIYADASSYYLRFLSFDEAFMLFHQRVFGNNRCPVELESIAHSITESCGYLPITLVMIAGALRGNTSKTDWERVDRCLRMDPRSWENTVELTYDYLPQELKLCFLYCGTILKDIDIPSQKLICLWIAEGLINSSPGENPEEIAESYLDELVARSLVMVIEKRCNGEIKTCRIHETFHDFCKTKSTSDGIHQILCLEPHQDIPTIQDPYTCRRLSIEPSVLADFLTTEPFAEHVRSFLCLPLTKNLVKLSDLHIRRLQKAFPLIRVLDIEPVHFFYFEEFSQLFLLRYIAISGHFKIFPEAYGAFSNLQTLVLNTSTSEPTLNIKANIRNMLKLRHLLTNIPAILPSPPPLKGKPSSLQTLSLVAPESCTNDVLAKVPDLKKLSIQGEIADFLRDSVDGLHHLKVLEQLKLLNCLDSSEVISFSPAHFKFLHSLKKLTLSNTWSDWREAELLGQLQCLEVLKLKHNAFTGESWTLERSGFSRLMVLWIDTADIECWRISSYNFQVLRRLVLISCENLEALPLELADIATLEELRLQNTSKAIKSAKDIKCRRQAMRRNMESSNTLNLTIRPFDTNDD